MIMNKYLPNILRLVLVAICLFALYLANANGFMPTSPFLSLITNGCLAIGIIQLVGGPIKNQIGYFFIAAFLLYALFFISFLIMTGGRS